MKILVTDDTLRETAGVLTGGLRPGFRPFVDRQNRKIQRHVSVTHVFEGANLERAIRRARRHIRSPRFKRGGAPHHVALAMAAFHRADPEGFRQAVADAAR